MKYMSYKKRIEKNFILYIVGAIAGIMLIICFIIALIFSKDENINETVSFQLKGSEIMYLYVGENFNDPGFIALGSNNENISNYVTIESDVNTNYIGIYNITYKLDYKGVILLKERKVKVESRPIGSDKIENNVIEKEEISIGKNDIQKVDNTDRIRISLNGYSHLYLLKGNKYVDAGANAVTDSGKDVTSTIVTTGIVDYNQVGIYTLTYTVTDSAGDKASISRKVEVLDMNVSSTVSTLKNTNKSVILRLSIYADKFDYVILPDGKKDKNLNIEYVVDKNGKYSFKVVNEYGLSTIYTYNISNIDKEAPVGSCSGYTTGKNSYINVIATDDNGIFKYIVDNKSYLSNEIVLDKVISNPTIIIYDTVGNSKTISCELENRYTFVPSDSSITYDYEYVNDGMSMPYALFTPSSVNQNESTPVLVWLHGSGEVGTGEGQFKSAGLVAVMNNWKLDGFNAYIICPHLTGKYRGTWSNSTSLDNLNNLLDKFIKENNIDTDKIMLSGHSMGGLGSMYVAYHSSNRYSALAVMSGYYPGIDIQGIKIPTVGYVGTPAGGEDTNSYNFMVGSFKKRFGEENTFIRNTSHGALPRVAYTEDSNKDNKSDLMEWMIRQ